MQATPKPEGDKYGFTHFAHKLNSSEDVNPLPSDSRRRSDRHALQVREAGGMEYSLFADCFACEQCCALPESIKLY